MCAYKTLNDITLLPLATHSDNGMLTLGGYHMFLASTWHRHYNNSTYAPLLADTRATHAHVATQNTCEQTKQCRRDMHVHQRCNCRQTAVLRTADARHDSACTHIKVSTCSTAHVQHMQVQYAYTLCPPSHDYTNTTPTRHNCPYTMTTSCVLARTTRYMIQHADLTRNPSANMHT